MGRRTTAPQGGWQADGCYDEISAPAMPDSLTLLRANRNYRYAWLAQVVSEIGDYFNNVAVFSLAVQTSGSGLVVSGVMLARAIPAVAAGPVAGVVLDRFDRKRVMIASDLLRTVIAALLLTLAACAAHEKAADKAAASTWLTLLTSFRFTTTVLLIR